jgi:hypothetical protein
MGVGFDGESSSGGGGGGSTLSGPAQFQNSLFSWQCLRQRQRWFRCLDKDYLALKCVLCSRRDPGAIARVLAYRPRILPPAASVR